MKTVRIETEYSESAGRWFVKIDDEWLKVPSGRWRRSFKTEKAAIAAAQREVQS